MNIFNSLGSNYNLSIALRALTGGNYESKPKRLKACLERKYQGEAVLLYKGREAIRLALEILNFPSGSTVAVNGYTCYAVYKAVKNANCNIELIDIPETGLNFSASALEEKLRDNPAIKAVIIQNTLGCSCDISRIEEICKRENLILIEDLAHSVGTIYTDGREAGTVGDFTVLSFSQDKMIDGVSGGALIIRNKRFSSTSKYFKKIDFSQQARDRFYPFLTLLIRKTYGFGLGKALHALLKKAGALSMPLDNLDSVDLRSLPDWYCALAHRQFQALEKNIKHRRAIAAVYAKNLDPKLLDSEIIKNLDRSSNLRFPFFVQNRDSLIAYLKNFNIHISDIWYDAPIAPKKYANLAEAKYDCPRAEKVSAEMVNLPTHRNVSLKHAKIIAARVNEWLKSK